MWYKLTITFVIWLAVAGCKDFDTPPEESAVPEATNIAIKDLKALIGERAVVIEQDIIIGGYVTSSDQAGNFYKSFTIEDATGGAEIMAGLYDTHNTYPLGAYQTVHLEGCAIGQHYGITQIGMPPASYSTYPTEYFSSQVLLDRHIHRYAVIKHIAPEPLLIADLEPSMCGRLVNIGDLHYDKEQTSAIWNEEAEGRWMGYNIFVNEKGEKIAVYTSEYADYAQKQLPTGKVAITGILQRGKVGNEEIYMIKMRDEKDCVKIN